jgi:1,2-diacylglycerol 3-alpha-glucosyltransferase
MIHKQHPRPRICMLAACPFPANHGTPGSIREMAEALVEQGHAVHVVTYHFGEDIPIRGPVLHRIAPLTRETAVVVGPTVRRPLYDLQMVFKAIQVIRQHRLDLIHAHGYEAALVAWLCRLATGLPVVYSGHNTMADELPSYRFIRPQWLAHALAAALDGFVPRMADRCLPHSVNIQRFFHEMGLRSRTEPIINFGINVDWVQGGSGEPIRRRYGLDGGPVIAYAGVLDQFQRLDLLIDAMAEVCAREAKAKLLVVVTVPNEKHLATLRRHVADRGVTANVVITGPQPLHAVRDFLLAADIAVVPRPQAPGFPIKLLNYMAACKPCVLYASSASVGLRNRDNCLLAAPDSAGPLAHALMELIGDADLRQRLGRNGHQFVRIHHDRKAIARQIGDCYLRALAQGEVAPSLLKSHFTPHAEGQHAAMSGAGIGMPA